MSDQGRMNVLVLGAYGLIGSGVARFLRDQGHHVTGFGRDITTGRRLLPDLTWHSGDLRDLTEATAWHPFLDGVDAVVNCSGALQDGPTDDLEAVHHHAVAALASACCAADIRLIQISAVGATLDAPTAFLATKARGDAAVQASTARYQIFRPGLVLARQSYGGSTMLRMLAAVPLVQPVALPDAKIQTVSLDDVAQAVSGALTGNIPDGFVGDLVETDVHSLRDVLSGVRHWLGFGPARFTMKLPNVAVAAVSKLADSLSRLGWKSPLRSTSIAVLINGVQGRPTDMTHFGLPPVSSFQDTLSRFPVGAQDRLFARMALLTPIMIGGLCLFWVASGVIGLVRAKEAATVLEAVGWSTGMAVTSVVFWAFVDIAIGIGFAMRKYAPAACWAAVIVSMIYLVASTVTVPSLWADPLGPLVKIVPAAILAVVARAGLDAR